MNKLPASGQLNLVPFIDIMLVLLCIVLSISSFIATGKIKVDLPQAQTSVSTQEQKIIFISIDKDNQIFVDAKSLSKQELITFIDKLETKDHVQLQVDKAASFDSFVQIIDLLKQKQHENFSIATQLQ